MWSGIRNCAFYFFFFFLVLPFLVESHNGGAAALRVQHFRLSLPSCVCLSSIVSPNHSFHFYLVSCLRVCCCVLHLPLVYSPCKLYSCALPFSCIPQSAPLPYLSNISSAFVILPQAIVPNSLSSSRFVPLCYTSVIDRHIPHILTSIVSYTYYPNFAMILGLTCM